MELLRCLQSTAQRVATAFGVTVFGPLGKAPATFLGKRPDGVPVIWRLDQESGEVLCLIVGGGVHRCAAYQTNGKWESAPNELFDGIMASALEALGLTEVILLFAPGTASVSEPRDSLLFPHLLTDGMAIPRIHHG